ncbi:MAG: VWA domain-containing protein [Campylobacteraceae bacterium]|mgnify:CR=1 FL=1|nr:VWA domain-containing protein [Campylobacteraceae bacterium]
MFSFANFSFENLWVLALLVVPFAMLFLVKRASLLENLFTKEVLKEIYVKKQGFSKKTRAYLLILSLAFLIIALARPINDNGEIEVNESYIDVAIGLDISASMSVDDLFPNRFEFAKRKIFDFIDSADDKRVGVVGFSGRGFLISPLTSDFGSLKYLVKNLNFDYLSLKGTSIMELLMSVSDLYSDTPKKALVIFTDGGDNADFTKEIAFAKKHNITVFIYMVATNKGGLYMDDSGSMNLLKANEEIKDLALKSGGAYMRHSLDGLDMARLNEMISAKFESGEEKEKVIRDTKELFYYPLILSIVFFFMANFSLPNFKKEAK